jgi:hypothetical protein
MSFIALLLIFALNGCAPVVIGLAMNAAGAKGGSESYQPINPSLAPNGARTLAAH